MTAEDLDGLARLAAAAVRSSGVAGAPVGLMAPNGPGFLAALIALRRSGCPVVLLDPRGTAEETREASTALGPIPVLSVASAWPADEADFHVTLPGADAGPATFPDGTAVVKMTSGSTGEVRGVAATSEALLADDAALRRCMGIGPDDRLLASVPFSHSYGLSSLVVPALVAGLPLVMPGQDGPFAPLLAARRCAATVLHTVPAWVAAIVRLAEAPPWPESLRIVISAGGPIQPRAAREFRQRCGLAIHVFYGATECGGIAYDSSGDAGERGTVGEPIPGVRVTLRPMSGIDSRSGQVVVESPAVGLAYVAAGRGAPEEPDAHLADGRFVSQDLATREGEALRLLGRLDDLINVHGRKVRPAEVEQVIAGIDAVEEVVVHAFHDGGNGDASVRAVVACPRGALTGQEVLEWCRGRLSDFKIPRTVLLVEELPRTGRGKIDRAAAARIGSEGSHAHG